MRLSDLLARLSPAQVAELARRIVPGADDYPTGMWANAIEVMLRNSGHVEHSIVTRRPPVLALLVLVLEAEGRSLRRQEAQEAVASQTARWTDLVRDGSIVGDDRCGLYRRLLAGAWANDLQIDASENALLGLLRHELRMTQVEHFLVSHHPDVLQHFNGGAEDYDRVVDALIGVGVLYEFDGIIFLPEELVPHARRALGVQIERDGARRLLNYLGNEELHSALSAHHLRLAGSKQERIERLVEALAPIDVTLDQVHINSLGDLSRKLGLPISGSKEQKIQRLIEHFDMGRDLLAAMSEPEPPIVAEPKELSCDAFGRLFIEFTAHQLKDALMALDQRHSGGKEKLIERLWQSPFSENTILRKFSNSDLQDAFRNSGIDARGNKDERIAKIIAHFAMRSETAPQ